MKVVTQYEDFLLLLDAVSQFAHWLGPQWSRNAIGLAFNVTGFGILSYDQIRVYREAMSGEGRGHPLQVKETEWRKRLFDEIRDLDSLIRAVEREGGRPVTMDEMAGVIRSIKKTVELQLIAIDYTGLMRYRTVTERWKVSWLSGRLANAAIPTILIGALFQLLALVP